MPTYDITTQDGRSFTIDSPRDLNDDEWRQLEDQLSPSQAETTSVPGTIARAVGESLLPSAGALAGATYGAELGAAGGPIGAAAGGLVGGLLGAWTAGKAQRLTAEQLFPKATKRFEELQAEDVAQHPVARFAGAVAGAVPSFGFAPGRAVSEIAALARGGAEALPAAVSLGGKLSAGALMGAGGALLEGQRPTFGQIAESAAFPLLLGGGPMWRPRAPAEVPVTETFPGRTGESTFTAPKEVIEQIRQATVQPTETIPVEAKAEPLPEPAVEENTPEQMAARAEELLAAQPAPVELPSPQVQTGEIVAAAPKPLVGEAPPPPSAEPISGSFLGKPIGDFSPGFTAPLQEQNHANWKIIVDTVNKRLGRKGATKLKYGDAKAPEKIFTWLRNNPKLQDATPPPVSPTPEIVPEVTPTVPEVAKTVAAEPAIAAPETVAEVPKAEPSEFVKWEVMQGAEGDWYVTNGKKSMRATGGKDQAEQSASALNKKRVAVATTGQLYESAREAKPLPEPVAPPIESKVLSPEPLTPASKAEILPAKPKTLPPNSSFVRVVNIDGIVQGYVTVPHDGTPEGAIKSLAQAQKVAHENFRWKDEYYNVESQNGATDAAGKLKWVISPNRLHIAEPTTAQARYILGDLSAAPKPAALLAEPTPPTESAMPEAKVAAAKPEEPLETTKVRPISEIQKELSRTRAAVKISDPTKKRGKEARARLARLEDELKQATQHAQSQPSGPVYWTRESTQTDISKVRPTQAADMGERVKLANGQVWEYKGISGYRVDNLNRVNGWEKVSKPPAPPSPAAQVQAEVAKPQSAAKASTEFDDLVKKYAPQHEWVSDPNRLYIPGLEKQTTGLGSAGLAAKREYHKQLKIARRNAASAIGVSPDSTESIQGRAEALPKLKDYLLTKSKEAEQKTDAGFREAAMLPRPASEPEKPYQLPIGTKFKYKGEEFEVVKHDPKTGTVTVKDGRTFGTKDVFALEDLHVDKGTVEIPVIKKPVPELLPAKEIPFNLAREETKFVEPTKETTAFGEETLSQSDLFRIQDIVKEVDPEKSANAMQKQFGSASEAVRRLESQLATMAKDPKSYKSFSKEQRGRLNNVINLLRQRATEKVKGEPGPGMTGLGGAIPAEFAPEPVIGKGPLPDPGDWQANKKIFAQPFGFEKVPFLGKLFGGARRMADYIHESLATYWGVRGKGRAIASALGNEYSWLDKVFPTQKGRIANLPGIAPEQGPYISDFFEALQRNPNAYKLTPEQRQGFDAIQKLETGFDALQSKYKVGRNLDTEGGEFADDLPKKGEYFPRIVTKRPTGVRGLFRGTSVGAKPFFEKPRIFDTEAQGWSKGYEYETSIASRIATRSERLYKRIADRELASDPSLEPRSPKEVMAGLRETFADEIASGEMTDKKLQAIADGIAARGRVYQPAFYGKIFPEDTARILNRAFPQSTSVIRAWAASTNNALKGLQLGLDLGVGFIQGQGLLARYPAIWAKANVNSIRALFSKEFFPDYVRQNIEPIRELAQLGSGIGRLEEYMAGLGRGELLTKVPIAGKGVEAFGRQFHTFLDVAKVEMWKGLRESVPRSEWPTIAQALESIMMSGRMESVGISGTRALTERALLLAPAYYRGGLNLIAGLAEKGVSGQIMRQAMVAYATGGAVLFYGVAKALGMSDEEIQRRFNPMRSDFMLWKIKTGDKTTELGFGGFYRSLIRLMGNTARTSIEHPENWASLAPDKNPITKWYRGHAGPLVGLTWNQFSGRDYLGRDVDLRSAVGAVTPLTLAATRPAPGQPKPTGTEIGGSFLGLSGFTKTNAENLRELRTLHTDWQRKNPNPAIRRQLENTEAFNKTSDYRDLDNALATNDLEGAAKEYRDLIAGGRTPRLIMQRYQPIGPLFNDSIQNFFKFRKTLKPEQQKILQGALDERKLQWQRFRAMRARLATKPKG